MKEDDAGMTRASQPLATVASVVPSTAPSPSPSAGKRETGLKHLVAGSIAGMAAKTILQPLDLVKVRLQVQDGTGRNEYRGVVNAVQRIVREEGLLGLYRGLTPNLIAAGVSWGTYFFSYNQFKDFFKRRVLQRLPAASDPSLPAVHVQLGPLTHLACAAASGALATTLTNPIVLVKTRLQLQGKDVLDAAALSPHSAAPAPAPAASASAASSSSSSTFASSLSTPRSLRGLRPSAGVGKESYSYSGMLDAFTRIVREEGFLSLYRGLGPSLVLVSNGSLQFMAYEELKALTVRHVVGGREEQLRSHHFFLMGGLAKIFSATVTYPFAVTRSRLFARKPQAAAAQPASLPPSPSPASPASASAVPHHRDSKYAGMWDAMRATWRYEGWRGFYKGLTPQLLKTAPSSAITFLIYETVVKLLNHPTVAVAATPIQHH